MSKMILTKPCSKMTKFRLTSTTRTKTTRQTSRSNKRTKQSHLTITSNKRSYLTMLIHNKSIPMVMTCFSNSHRNFSNVSRTKNSKLKIKSSQSKMQLRKSLSKSKTPPCLIKINRFLTTRSQKFNRTKLLMNTCLMNRRNKLRANLQRIKFKTMLTRRKMKTRL